MSDGDRARETFEQLVALAREARQSAERVVGQLDLDEMADRIATGGERVSELAEFAGRWIKDQVPGGGRPRLGGPHPRDVPTEEQALALSALDSGRWKVEPGTNELISDGEGANPRDRAGLVSALHARDWITASGEVTLLGRAALRRWEESATPS